jgi:hypothetical protein
MSLATRSALSGTIRANQALLHRSSMVLPDPAPDQLESDYVQLNRDIAMLWCELKFMREHATELEQMIFFDDGALLPHSVLRNPVGQGNCAMVEIILHQTELATKLDQTRLHIGTVAVHSLQEEVNDGKQMCRRSEAALADLKSQTLATAEEINSYRESTLFQECQKGKNRVIDLYRCLAIEKQNHENMRSKIHQLLDGPLSQERVHNREVEQTQKLERKLADLRRRCFERFEAFTKLKDRHVSDLRAARECLENSALAANSDPKQRKDRTISELLAESASGSDGSESWTEVL